jgi:hypothetical protein
MDIMLAKKLHFMNCRSELQIAVSGSGIVCAKGFVCCVS